MELSQMIMMILDINRDRWLQFNKIEPHQMHMYDYYSKYDLEA